MSEVSQHVMKAIKNAFPKLLGVESSPQDALSYNNVHDSARDEAAMSDPQILLWRWLGHIPANPNKVDNTQLLINSYVYVDEQDVHRNPRIVNGSEKATDLFVARLIKASQDERALAVTPDSELDDLISQLAKRNRSRHKFFFLTGPRGIGKTYYLNHVLSKYNKKFDDEKVVWVRINLPMNRSFDDDLDHWVQSQITKILVRYYEHSSTHCKKPSNIRLHLIQHLMEWSRTGSSENGERRVAAIERIQRIFCGERAESDISPSICPEDVTAEVFRYARELGFSFIVVFDGLDKLDYDLQSGKRFNRLLSGFERLSESNANYGCIYVLVSRTNTVMISRSVKPFQRGQIEDTFQVYAPTAASIVEKRLESILRWLNSLPVTTPRTTGTDVPENTYQLRNLVSDFKSYIFDENRIDKLENSLFENLNDLDGILFENSRGKTQIIQAMYIDFIGATARGKRTGYRLVEYLTSAGRDFPPMIYNYPLGQNGIHSKIIEHLDYDTRFLPIIFRAPMPIDSDEKPLLKDYYIDTSLLHGIRILQLLIQHSELRNYQHSHGKLEICDLMDICHRWFSYNREITKIMIQELEVFELVVIRREYFSERISDHDSAEITPKGERFMRQVVFDVAYLNLSAMRLLISSDFLTRHGVVIARSPAGKDASDLRQKRRKWIEAKLSNGLLMCSLIQAANEKQRETLRDYQPMKDSYSVERLVWDRGTARDMFRQVEDWGQRTISELENIEAQSLANDYIPRNTVPDLYHALQKALS